MIKMPNLNFAVEQSLLVEFGESIDIELNDRVRNLMFQLE